MKLAYYAEAALRLLYPADCSLCRKLLELEEKHLCSSCQRLMASKKYVPWTSLDLRIPPLQAAWTFYPYESPVKELLTGIKFQRKTWLVKTFGPDIQTLKQNLPLDFDAAVPIPLDRMKLIQREFNQSALFAKKIASALQIPMLSVLKKKYATVSQNQLTRRERSSNLRGVFQLKDPRKIKDKNILLVDDILTTGATAQEAARTLKKHGARRICLLAVAYTEVPA